MTTGAILEEPLASTFDLATGGRVTVEILGAPTPGGLCRCQVKRLELGEEFSVAILGAPTLGEEFSKVWVNVGAPIVRHRDKLTPLNAAARQLLGKQ